MEHLIVALLDDYKTMTKSLKDLREDQLKLLLNHEATNMKRPTFLERLHMRYTKVRSQRERAELMIGGVL